MLAPFSLCVVLAGVAQAVNVYLSPPRTFLASSLSPEDASAALSLHLGLEAFEPLPDASRLVFDEEYFVGQGEKSAIVLTMGESYADVILPNSLQLAFTLPTPPSTPILSLASVISTYLHRASHWFASLFPSSHIESLDDVRALVSFFDSVDESAFAAVDLSRLFGESTAKSKEELSQIAHELRAFLNQIVHDDKYSLAILTYTAPSFVKRQALESQAPLPSTAAPHLPIGAISTCFTSLDNCKNVTNSCSGRGQCVEATKAGRTCFICTCGVTKSGEGNNVKTDYWAGEKCERKDISGPFVLISGTVIVIILLIAGSISLLYTVGEQPLPSTLLATAVNVKRE